MKVVVILTAKYFNGHFKGGQPTMFADSVRQGKKIHTCRDNFNYWYEKIASLKASGGSLSIREWTGKPYRSQQGVILEVPSDKVHVSELILWKKEGYYKATINDKVVDLGLLAKNDGLQNERDFISFMEPLFVKYGRNVIRLAVIHFSEFVY